jgi:hypothetical protein
MYYAGNQYLGAVPRPRTTSSLDDGKYEIGLGVRSVSPLVVLQGVVL